VRHAFFKELEELASRDPRIVLLTGDIGFSILEPFARRFPGRFINAGVAEQNMVGVATGIAEAGLVPFVYSIGPFAVLRPFEFIRNGPVLQRLRVRIVAAGGGVEYGAAGPTHHLVEDLALMRTQRELAVVVPADCAQAAAALRATWDMDGPVYYRISRNSTPPIPGLDGRFSLDGVATVRPGCDVLLLALGPPARACLETADVLASRGVSAAVDIAASLTPALVQSLSARIASFRLVAAVEPHHIDGGLGSAIAELIAEQGLPCRLVRRGFASAAGSPGSQDFLEKLHGLSSTALADAVLRHLGTASPR
jgi:transketolase